MSRFNDFITDTFLGTTLMGAYVLSDRWNNSEGPYQVDRLAKMIRRAGFTVYVTRSEDTPDNITTPNRTIEQRTDELANRQSEYGRPTPVPNYDYTRTNRIR